MTRCPPSTVGTKATLFTLPAEEGVAYEPDLVYMLPSGSVAQTSAPIMEITFDTDFNFWDRKDIGDPSIVDKLRKIAQNSGAHAIYIMKKKEGQYELLTGFRLSGPIDQLSQKQLPFDLDPNFSFSPKSDKQNNTSNKLRPNQEKSDEFILTIPITHNASASEMIVNYLFFGKNIQTVKRNVYFYDFVKNCIQRSVEICDFFNAQQLNEMNEASIFPSPRNYCSFSNELSSQKECYCEEKCVTTSFLLQTLVPKRSMRCYKGVYFTTLTTWRTPIKKWQVYALRLLKKELSTEFVCRAAQDFAERIKVLGISGLFDAVTSVPCGSSGPRCLSEEMAARVADIVGLPFYKVFRHIETNRSSHPAKNGSRGKIEIGKIEKGRYLVLDDVVTSGSHISEATRRIREIGSTAFPIGWIGSV